MAKNLKSKLTSTILAGAIGLSAFLPGNANAAPGQIKIQTHPIGITNSQGIATWNADGTTEYEIQIRADSTDIPTNVIKIADWHFIIPTALNGYMQFTRSTIPDIDNNPSQNTNDFFYNLLMDDGENYLDDSIDGNGELNPNARARDVSVQGVSNRPYANGILGSYFFTLPVNTPKGYFTNSMNSIFFYDSYDNQFGSVN
jgi:hypothetical protein